MPCSLFQWCCICDDCTVRLKQNDERDVMAHAQALSVPLTEPQARSLLTRYEDVDGAREALTGMARLAA